MKSHVQIFPFVPIGNRKLPNSRAYLFIYGWLQLFAIEPQSNVLQCLIKFYECFKVVVEKKKNRLMVNRNCQTPESIMFIGETHNECEYNLYYKNKYMLKCELFNLHRCISFYEYAGFIKNSSRAGCHNNEWFWFVQEESMGLESQKSLHFYGTVFHMSRNQTATVNVQVLKIRSI